MRRPLLLALSLALALPLSARAQGPAAVRGTVTDPTGAPLPAATVLLEGTGLGASTDAEGAFALPAVPPGAYVLRASMVGYAAETREIDLTAGQTLEVHVALAPVDYSLGRDVVVTATRTEQAVATAPASISVVSGHDLQQRPVGDLSDALRDLPGLSLGAGSQGRRQIQIRGMDGSYTLVLIDGKRVNSSEAVFRHNDFDIGLLPVEAVERIEVVRGGMSALYGSEALGGVVNIITKPAGGDWGASLTTELQTPTSGEGGGEVRASVHAGGALVPGRLGLTLSGGLSRRDAWHGGGEGLLLDDDGEPVTRPDGSLVQRRDLATLEGRDDHSGRARLTWTPGARHTLEAEGGLAYQARSGEYYISGWGNADSELRRADLVLTHRADLALGASELRAYGERVETEDGLAQTNAVLEGHATAPLGRHTLTLGAEARWVDLEALAEFTSGSASLRQQALYAQDDLRLTGRLALLAGARLDHHETFGLHLTPRAYAVFSATEGLTLKAGLGTAFKAPTLRQASRESQTRSCRGQCLVVGNPSLHPETSTSLEASVNLDVPAWGASVTLFQNVIGNLIDTPRGTGVEPVGVDPETQLPMFVPRNVRRARIRGIEAAARLRLGRLGRLTANYTWLDARDLEEGVRLDGRPRHAANGRLDALLGPRLTAFVRAQLVGPQTSGALELASYALLDLGASVRLREGLWLNTGVQNVTGTRTDEAHYSFAERGRTVSVGLNVRL